MYIFIYRNYCVIYKMDEENICKLNDELQSYDYVRFTWPDIHGIPRGITVAKRNVPSLLSSGLYIYCGW